MNIVDFEIKSRNPQDPYLIPAVIYGHHVKENIICAINKRDFVKLVKANTRNTIIQCRLEDGTMHPTLIKEIQKNIISLEPIHVDFFAIDLEEPITITIPIHLHGTPIGVKNSGILVHQIHELTLSGKPEDLPSFVNLDIHSLDIGQHLALKDLPLSSNVNFTLNKDLPVVSIQSPHVEMAPETAEQTTEESKETKETPPATP